MAISHSVMGTGRSSTSTATTSSATSTAGATFAVCCAWDASTTPGGLAITDNKSNTWSTLGSPQADGNGGYIQWYYSFTGLGGSGHTFTCTALATAFPTISAHQILQAGTSLGSGAAQGQDSGGQPFVLTSGTLPSGNWLLLAGCINVTGSNGDYSANSSTPTMTLVTTESDISNYWTHGTGVMQSSGSTAVTPSFGRSGTAGGTSGLALIVFAESAAGDILLGQILL